MAGDDQNVTTAIRNILEQNKPSFEGVRELIELHASYQDERSKSIIREQTERMILNFPSPHSSHAIVSQDIIKKLFDSGPTKNGKDDIQFFYQEVGRLCRDINSGELKQLLNPVKPEQNQTSIVEGQKTNEQQDPNQVNARKLYALSGLTAYFDDDNITSSGKLLDPNEVKMTSFVTVILIVATVLSYVLPIPDPLSASLGVVAVGKTFEAVYHVVRKQNFSKASELLGEAIGLGVSAGLVAFGVRFVTPITLGIGISIAGLAACNTGYNRLQNLANNSVYTSSKIFYQTVSLPLSIPAHVFKGGSYLIQKSAKSVKNLAKNLSQRITNKPNSATNSTEEQQPLIKKQSSFHDDTHKKSVGITVLAVKILSGVLGGIRLPFQVAINMMKLSTTAYYEDTRKALCEVVIEHHDNMTSDPDLHWNSLANNTSFSDLNAFVNTNGEHRICLLEQQESRNKKVTPVISTQNRENTTEIKHRNSSQNGDNQHDEKYNSRRNIGEIANELTVSNLAKNRHDFNP